MHYIAIEGIDGAGKSTQIARLEKWFTKTHSVRVVHYTNKLLPPFGLLLTRLYVGPANSLVRQIRRSQLIQSLLYAANGRQNVKVALKSRPQPEILLGDRCILTSLAVHPNIYNGLGARILWRLEALYIPSLIILLDLDPVDAMDRLKSRNEHGVDERLDRQREIRANYIELARGSSKHRLGSVHFKIVDGKQEEGLIHQEICSIIQTWLP